MGGEQSTQTSAVITVGGLIGGVVSSELLVGNPMPFSEGAVVVIGAAEAQRSIWYDGKNVEAKGFGVDNKLEEDNLDILKKCLWKVHVLEGSVDRITLENVEYSGKFLKIAKNGKVCVGDGGRDEHCVFIWRKMDDVRNIVFRFSPLKQQKWFLGFKKDGTSKNAKFTRGDVDESAFVVYSLNNVVGEKDTKKLLEM